MSSNKHIWVFLGKSYHHTKRCDVFRRFFSSWWSDLYPNQSLIIDWYKKIVSSKKIYFQESLKKATYCRWIQKIIGSGSEIALEAFLEMWLSRFSFPSLDGTVPKIVLQIAIHLAKGTRITLLKQFLLVFILVSVSSKVLCKC